MISAKYIAKKKEFFVTTPPSDLNTHVLQSASLFFVVSLASLLGVPNVMPLFQHLMCLVHYYRDESRNQFCEKVVWQIALLFQHFMRSGHYCGRIWTWFDKKLVGLNHPKHLLVSACLCCGLQSQSPTDPHLCAYVGVDCNPEFKAPQVLFSGIKMNDPYSPPKGGQTKNKSKNKKTLDSVNQKQLRKAEFRWERLQKNFPSFWVPLQNFCTNKIQTTQHKT